MQITPRRRRARAAWVRNMAKPAARLSGTEARQVNVSNTKMIRDGDAATCQPIA